MRSNSHNIAVKNPELAAQWHPTKNGSLTPSDVTPWSHKKIWWVCERGHEWSVRVGNRTQGNGCPYCSGWLPSAENNLAGNHPTLAGEWHPTKNGELVPSNVTPGSGKKVWWVCKRGHEWRACVQDRSYGKGCPYCAGKKVSADNNLAAKIPGLSVEWHPTKNGSLKPSDVTPGSAKKVWWICDLGHEWCAAIYNRTRRRSTGCPVCHRSKSQGKR